MVLDKVIHILGPFKVRQFHGPRRLVLQRQGWPHPLAILGHSCLPVTKPFTISTISTEASSDQRCKIVVELINRALAPHLAERATQIRVEATSQLHLQPSAFVVWNYCYRQEQLLHRIKPQAWQQTHRPEAARATMVLYFQYEVNPSTPWGWPSDIPKAYTCLQLSRATAFGPSAAPSSQPNGSCNMERFSGFSSNKNWKLVTELANMT